MSFIQTYLDGAIHKSSIYGNTKPYEYIVNGKAVGKYESIADLVEANKGKSHGAKRNTVSKAKKQKAGGGSSAASQGSKEAEELAEPVDHKKAE